MIPSKTRTNQRKLACVAVFCGVVSCAGCEKPDDPSARAATQNSATAEHSDSDLNRVPTLLLAQAQFKMSRDAAGKQKPIPGPGLVTVLQRKNNVWIESTLSDSRCLVFHKAEFIDDPPINGRILTIGGTEARLCAWTWNDLAWNSEEIWNPKFGGRFDRLRDFEIGDVDHDGNKDIVVGTHDQGVIAVHSQVRGHWNVREIDRAPRTFVHEIELGDTDGDGQLEIFATPSQPNQATLMSQPGRIVQYRLEGAGIFKRTIAELKDTHCKEILAIDIDQDGKDELVAAIEARMEMLGGRAEIVEPVQIVLFRESEGQFVAETIAEIADRMCRVLCAGDVDGDTRTDIILTTMESGIWWLRLSENRQWKLQTIDRNSSGIEHAATLHDFDGRGRDNIYVASEREGELREYVWTGSEFKSTVIAILPKNQLTFSITASKMPIMK
jgi:hypothetical protein